MSIPPQSITTWLACMTVCHSLAMSSTVYRVIHRFRMRRLWWDDYLAFVALFFDVIYFATLWVRLKTRSRDPPLSTEIRVALYYLSALPFFFVIWLSRVSMALSFARIFPPEVRVRRFAMSVAWLFGFSCSILIVQVVVSCTVNTSWHHTENVQCRGKGWISALCMDLVADTILIAMPITTLYRVQLPKNPRRLVLSVFAASVWSGLASIVLHVFLFGPKSWGIWTGFLVLMMAHLEASICLLVCNLLVVVTVYYRVFRNGQDIEYDTESAFSARTSAILRSLGLSSSSVRRTTVILTELSGSMYITDSESEASSVGAVDSKGSSTLEDSIASPRTVAIESLPSNYARHLARPGAQSTESITPSNASHTLAIASVPSNDTQHSA